LRKNSWSGWVIWYVDMNTKMYLFTQTYKWQAIIDCFTLWKIS
jgi:hypothetical protein